MEVELTSMDILAASSIEEQTVYEYQRWQPVRFIAVTANFMLKCLQVVLWGSDYPGHLLPTDPGRFDACHVLFCL